MKTRRRHPRALALPIVMWAIAFIGGLVVLVATLVGDWADEASQAERAFRARQMALSGVAIGRNRVVKPGDPILRSGTQDSEGYEVVLSNEGGRINPNFWIARNGRAIFQQIFERWEVDDRLGDASIDSLTDWIDGDDFRSSAGAERGEYEAVGRAGFPANRPLLDAREMEAVLNLSDILATRPGWTGLFTVWHNGKINVQHAKTDVLGLVAGLDARQIEALLALRAGPDAIDGSGDDVVFESIETVSRAVGADARQSAALDQFFDTQGGARRIESTGYCAGEKYTITVITNEEGTEMLAWEEK